MSGEIITQIQQILMHQEQQISELSKMVVQQWSEIDLLKKHIRNMQNEIDVVSETAGRLSGASEKPPHY
ncbi:MAG: SlyX family protein [Alphaproteobacteria bacterium]|nr:SlyX family protein [Alphaproteobacteria bacterium]